MTFADVPNELTSFKLLTRARNAPACSQALSIWNWTTGAWGALGTVTVGTTEVQFDRVPAPPLRNWVSGTSGLGSVRVRVRCTHASASFTSSGELVRIAHGP